MSARNDRQARRRAVGREGAMQACRFSGAHHSVIVEIVPMRPEDVPIVMEIERASHIEPWTEVGFLEDLNQLAAFSFVALTEECPDAEETGAVGVSRFPHPSKDAVIVGYICFWIVADEVQIFNIAVKQGCRRLGIGRRLMLHALRTGLGRGAAVAHLEVRQHNVAARRLYEALGFQVVGVRPNYYGVVDEPAIIMALSLEEPRSPGGGGAVGENGDSG